MGIFSGFGEGFEKSFDQQFANAPNIMESGMRARAYKDEKKSLEAAEKEELEGQKAFSQFAGGITQEAGAEQGRLQDKEQALSMSRQLFTQLSATEPGPERDLQISGLPKEIAPGVATYLKRAPANAFTALMAATEADEGFSTEKLKAVLSNPEAAGQAITQAQGVAAALKEDPQGFAFQGEMRKLSAKQAQIQVTIDKAWQAYTRMPPGAKAARSSFEKFIGGMQAQLSSLETMRNNLSSPQQYTQAQGTQNVGGFIDPSTGDMVQTATSEQPVYVTQRGQQDRLEQSEAGKFARASAARSQSASNTERLAAVQQHGRAPSGYRFTDDGSLEAIPGGPAVAAQAEAGIELQKSTDQADMALGVLDELRNHPGLSGAVGAESSFPTVPGSSSADFENILEQVKGGAFLEAVAQLKGSGAISEAEGKAATSALARLSLKSSDKALRKSIDVYEGIVKKGIARAKLKAKSLGKKESANRDDEELTGDDLAEYYRLGGK